MDTKKIFSLKSKIIIIIGFNLILLFVLIYLVSTFFLLKSFKNIEQDLTIQRVQRASDAIVDIVNQLSIKTTDWAWWDDTYKFINDKNKAYIESNLGVGSISNLKINTMVYVNANEDIIFKKMIDFKNKKELSSESIGEHINTHKILSLPNAESKVQGVILLPEGLMIIAALPILTSDGEGPVLGTILFGKFLDNDIISEIGKLIRLPLSIYLYDNPSLPLDVITAKSKLSQDETIFINPLTKTLIAGYTIVNDVYNKPLFILKIETPREIYNQGQFTLYSFMAIASLLIILFGIILILLLERLVIFRLSLLGKDIDKISTTQDLSFRVKEGEKDEIGKLAIVINRMLEALYLSKKTE